MDDNITLKKFRELTDNERKRFNRDQLISILLNAEMTEISDLSTAIQNLTEMVAGFKKQQEEDSVRIVSLNSSVQLLKDENLKIRKELTERINRLEQRTRIINIEIVGLRKPSLMETDTGITLSFLKEKVGVEVTGDEIEALHEVPSRRTDNKRIVIVHFKSRARRDSILSLSKKKLRDINAGLEQTSRIYVNEHLSPENKKLFAMTTKKKT